LHASLFKVEALLFSKEERWRAQIEERAAGIIVWDAM